MTTLSAHPDPVTYSELHALLLSHEFIHGNTFTNIQITTSSTPPTANLTYRPDTTSTQGRGREDMVVVVGVYSSIPALALVIVTSLAKYATARHTVPSTAIFVLCNPRILQCPQIPMLHLLPISIILILLLSIILQLLMLLCLHPPPLLIGFPMPVLRI